MWLADGRQIDDGTLQAYASWLSPGEAARHAGFTRPDRRRQFMIGRVLARQALGALCGLDAARVVLEERPGLGPLVIGLQASLSISHTGSWVACAVSTDCAIGLDIETIDAGRNIPALALHAFGEEEAALLAARPEAQRVRDFYVMWSKQEASIKLGLPSEHFIDVPHPTLSIALCCAEECSLAADTYQLVHQLGRG
ncbi:MAG: 4'-phosphopantetheinyl transferase superfamily protein [Pseudomonadota bacterium]